MKLNTMKLNIGKLRYSLFLLIFTTQILSGCTTVKEKENIEDLQSVVRETERAFAATMADRNFEGFKSFLSEEAIFFAGDKPLRGYEAVAEAWKPFFDEPDAPFSWQPKIVEVLSSGDLALSSGPVFDPTGKEVGSYNSIWRRNSNGAWLIIFDKGS
jgi:ketosteroid isomerase-like protein